MISGVDTVTSKEVDVEVVVVVAVEVAVDVAVVTEVVVEVSVAVEVLPSVGATVVDDDDVSLGTAVDKDDSLVDEDDSLGTAVVEGTGSVPVAVASAAVVVPLSVDVVEEDDAVGGKGSSESILQVPLELEPGLPSGVPKVLGQGSVRFVMGSGQRYVSLSTVACNHPPQTVDTSAPPGAPRHKEATSTTMG